MRRGNRYNTAGYQGWPGYNMGYPVQGNTDIPYYQQEMDPAEEENMLHEQAGLLKQQLDDIQKRMSDIKKDKKDK